MPDPKTTNRNRSKSTKRRLNEFYVRFRSLQGDPQYVARGMAIGVFVAVTPTFPFHMLIALAFAVVLRASKPAALIGAWFSNPVTIWPLYYGSYKLGMLILGRKMLWSGGNVTLQELLAQGLDVTMAMMLAGALLGIMPAVAAYFLTLVVFRKVRARRRKTREKSGATEDAMQPEDRIA